jgi:recombinational DNA repair ATPase RecF
MKIIKLKAKNIKGLKKAEIEPNENLILVTGKNGHGKQKMAEKIRHEHTNERGKVENGLPLTLKGGETNGY